jgi:tetratricopeptide (TPR) repeat protein
MKKKKKLLLDKQQSQQALSQQATGNNSALSLHDEAPGEALHFAEWINSVDYCNDADENTKTAESEPIILEQGKKLSESILFELMKTYYTNQGVNAWLNGTPNFITSNTIIAEGYADLIITFLLENLSTLTLDEPVYIVELAAGIGRFSFLTLKELERKMTYFSALQALKLVYVITDFTTEHTQYWKTHEAFQPGLTQGLLDVATFNPLVDQTIHLEVSNITLTPALLKNPVIVIANYFFDTITHDAFRVKSKNMSEGLVTVTRTLDNTTATDEPIDFSELEMYYEYKDVLNPKTYYDCPGINQVLNSYRQDIKDGTLIFPIGALQVLENLMTLCNRNMFLIASDKAYTDIERMSNVYAHTFACHSSISFMVNFDAIGRYFTQMGGHYWATQGEDYLWLQTICCTFTPKLDSAYEALNYTFEEKFNRGSQICALPQLLYESACSGDKSDDAMVLQLVAKTSLAWQDSRLLSDCVKALIPLAEKIDALQKKTLMCAIDKALTQHYHYPGNSNLPFHLGVLCYLMQEYQKSLTCLDWTIHYDGIDPALLFMKGQSLEKMNNPGGAISLYEEALGLNPCFEEAMVAKERLLTAS